MPTKTEPTPQSKVISSFLSLARLDLAKARQYRAEGRKIAAAYHLAEALDWRRHANNLRSTR